MPPSSKFLAHLGVVINFSVEDDDGVPVFTHQRLVSGSEVDDLKTDGAQRHVRALIYALLIRTAVREHTNSLANIVRSCRLATVRITDYATQEESAPSSCAQFTRGRFAKPTFSASFQDVRKLKFLRIFSVRQGEQMFHGTDGLLAGHVSVEVEVASIVEAHQSVTHDQLDFRI